MSIECDLAEPESLASLGGSAPGVVDGILSQKHITMSWVGWMGIEIEMYSHEKISVEVRMRQAL